MQMYSGLSEEEIRQVKAIVTRDYLPSFRAGRQGEGSKSKSKRKKAPALQDKKSKLLRKRRVKKLGFSL